jgi:hypothetical protein
MILQIFIMKNQKILSVMDIKKTINLFRENFHSIDLLEAT